LPVDVWDIILMHIVKKKLDPIKQKDWQNLIKKSNSKKYVSFIRVYRIFDRAVSFHSKFSRKKTAKTGEKGKSRNKKKEKRIALFTAVKCRNCEGNYLIYKCGNLLSLSIADRKKRLLEKKLYINYLYARSTVRSIIHLFTKMP